MRIISKLAKVSKELASLQRPDFNKESYAEEAAEYFTLQRQQLELMSALIVDTLKSKDFHDPIVYAIQERVAELDKAAQIKREIHIQYANAFCEAREQDAIREYGF